MQGSGPVGYRKGFYKAWTSYNAGLGKSKNGRNQKKVWEKVAATVEGEERERERTKDQKGPYNICNKERIENRIVSVAPNREENEGGNWCKRQKGMSPGPVEK